MSEKKSLRVRLASPQSSAPQSEPVRVAIYPGSSPEAIQHAIATALGLPAGQALLCRDADGDVVPLSDNLPTGLLLTVQPATPTAPSAPASSSPSTTVPIPGPKPLPIVGNLTDMKRGDLLGTAEALFAGYGDFVRIKLLALSAYLNCNADVVSELLARPTDFQKRTIGDRSPLSHLREYSIADALFTAEDDEESWHIAHRILLPTMGTGALKQYFPKMLEVTDQLLAQLSALGRGEAFLATDLMTRMTFETIAYTGFNTRFNCLQTADSIPFVEAMVEVLKDAMQAPMSLIPPSLNPVASHRRERANGILKETVDRIIQDRRDALERGDAVPNDILQTMLTARDRTSGKRLDDANIRNQLITFLIAGHETTSGLLSYALYYLSQNSQVEARLCEEIDRVLGRDFSYRPSFADIERLDYVGRVLKETLRLCPTAPGFNKTVMRDTVVIGKYAVSKGHRIVTVLSALHRHPRYWGSDAERFDPDRFLPEAVAARHPDAYHPFGIGMRSCIGFQFALIEARLVLAMLYQRFQPRTQDPHYTLAHVQTLTIKPKDLHMVLVPRAEEKGRLPQPSQTAATVASPAPNAAAGPPLYVLYGSNMGSCQDLAQGIARQVSGLGFAPVLAELNAFARPESLASLRGATLVIVTSTYNGNPPDNADAFARLLADPSLDKQLLSGLRFAVLGGGNKQWRTTFQKFPRYLFSRLQELGAQPFFELGSCDADGDFEAAAESWQRALLAAIKAQLLPGQPSPAPSPKASESEPLYRVELANFAGAQARAVLPNKYPLQDEARLGVILRNDELQSTHSERSTRHIEIELPEGMSYTAGDHLGVFPENPHDIVAAIAARCGVRSTDVVVLHETTPLVTAGALSGTGSAALPTGVPITVHDLLTHHIDLLGPLSRRELRALASHCPCPPEQRALLDLTSEADYPRRVLAEKLSLPALLSRFPSISCPLSLLLSL
ncbi:MAG TPA: cytochrome P450, partial [Pseudomonadota bacterium]|nr:cytochrome P450 [Pseudomonadota bacterium]